MERVRAHVRQQEWEFEIKEIHEKKSELLKSE